MVNHGPFVKSCFSNKKRPEVNFDPFVKSRFSCKTWLLQKPTWGQTWPFSEIFLCVSANFCKNWPSLWKLTPFLQKFSLKKSTLERFSTIVCTTLQSRFYKFPFSSSFSVLFIRFCIYANGKPTMVPPMENPLWFHHVRLSICLSTRLSTHFFTSALELIWTKFGQLVPKEPSCFNFVLK